MNTTAIYHLSLGLSVFLFLFLFHSFSPSLAHSPLCLCWWRYQLRMSMVTFCQYCLTDRGDSVLLRNEHTCVRTPNCPWASWHFLPWPMTEDFPNWQITCWPINALPYHFVWLLFRSHTYSLWIFVLKPQPNCHVQLQHYPLTTCNQGDRHYTPRYNTRVLIKHEWVCTWACIISVYFSACLCVNLHNACACVSV